MEVELEKRHVLAGPDRGERSASGTDRLNFRSPQPPEVLRNARTVLKLVLDHQAPWPSDDEWRSILPGWFVRACAPERTREEAQQWLERWRSLSAQQKAEEEARSAWTLSDWLYWFDPNGQGGDRGWSWWDAGVRDSSNGWIEVETAGYPYPGGALRWLIRACGGVPID